MYRERVRLVSVPYHNLSYNPSFFDHSHRHGMYTVK